MLEPGDDRPGADLVVVLSHGLWQRQFAGDRHIVGRKLVLDGKPHQVVGVMPPEFRYPDGAELWTAIEPAQPEVIEMRQVGWLLVIGASLLCGFGVYLGRFQRWNSWDIVTRPTELLTEAWSALAETHVLAFSVLFSAVLFAGYATLTVIVGRPASSPASERVLSADTSP